ncbi:MULTISPECIES: diaminopimelate decarboxylase [Priestia]|uniref:diaminopimelate decarboxylase n=1 Tax=Priestia TaxID=2800373 RepID=UPI0013F3F348|nr:diaminopimelate decarboxylase [Priestia megaterium]MEB2266138.1 diaminopimelate decarboxylase [Priestia megaterium]NGY82076.1 diaminopimelate decarboxylase [Priestia megaterium]
MYLHGTSKINSSNHLEIGQCDTVELKKQYGTPLYIYDQELIETKCKAFHSAFRRSGFSYQIAYAGKAFLCMEMASLLTKLDMSLDVVSGGELFTALEAGYPAERIHFHGNNKTIEEMEMALDANIGCFVVDNFTELEVLHALAAERKQKASILLRVTPGIEAHTHEYIMTGQEDSKFGFGLSNDQAMKAVSSALEKPYYDLLGIHCHIGSQIFEVDGFSRAIDILTDFLVSIRDKMEFEVKVLNVGGGFGIRYTESDSPLPVEYYVDALTEKLSRTLTEQNYTLPEVWIEPGRSIVGEAGTTLYTIGSTKEIPGVRKYVGIDGGMTDNIRPALYDAKHEAVLANRVTDKKDETVSIAGKCCESGDMLIWDIDLPRVNQGDLLAVSSTGAYNYSMASNYNRIPRPAVVFVKNGEARLAVERETYEDLVRKDVKPVVTTYAMSK